MTSPSATASLVSRPAPSASTGISIFIDSSITSVSPSATESPSVATTFQTLATISARISVTRTSQSIVAACAPLRAQMTHHGRVIVSTAELFAIQQIGMKWKVGLEPGHRELGDSLHGPHQRAGPVGRVHHELGQQRIVL